MVGCCDSGDLCNLDLDLTLEGADPTDPTDPADQSEVNFQCVCNMCPIVIRFESLCG